MTRLINSTYVINNSVILESVESKFIDVAIDNATQLYIVPTIGSKLYNKIVSLINDGTINSEANVHYKTLLDTKIIPCLMNYAVYESIIPLTFKVSPKGVLQNTNENSQTLQFNDVRQVSTFFFERAEKMLDLLKRHLRDTNNNVNYPEYLSSEFNTEDILPNDKAYSSPIYIKRKYRKYDDVSKRETNQREW